MSGLMNEDELVYLFNVSRGVQRGFMRNDAPAALRKFCHRRATCRWRSEARSVDSLLAKLPSPVDTVLLLIVS